MKKWVGGKVSTHIFHVVGVGFVIVKAASLGQLQIDDPDHHHTLSPLVRLPDCLWAIGDFTVSTIGFPVIIAVFWRTSQLSRHAT